MINIFLVFILIFQTVGYSNVFESASCENYDDEILTKIESVIDQQYSTVTFVELNINDLTFETEGFANQNLDCDFVKIHIPKNINFKENFVVKVDLFKNERFIKRRTKVYSVKGIANVLKITNKKYRGDLIRMDQFETVQLDIEDLTEFMISDFDANKRYKFKGFVAKDQFLESWMLEKMYDVQRNDFVKAIYQKGSIVLTLDAILMVNGNIGDRLEFKLKKNEKIMLGKLYDQETIVVYNH